MGGTPKRMENFAHFIMDEIGYKLPAGTQLQDISAFSYRYSMYKVIFSSSFLFLFIKIDILWCLLCSIKLKTWGT